jgi:acyl-CoA thioesterase I
MRRKLALSALLLLLAPSGDATEFCVAPSEITRLSAPLPRTAARLRDSAPLTIVAIGSSSTAGFGATSPAGTYPARLAAELGARLPGQHIEIHNKGIGGEEATDMLRRFDRDVLAYRPDLVIWQIGTNSMIRDEDGSRFEAVVREGIGRIKAAGADLLIMDMQYAPKVIGHPRHLEMEQRLDAIGRAENVAVFHRFALMHHWVTSGQLDFSRMLSPDGLHLNDLSYACVASALAAAIIELTAAERMVPVSSRR